MHSSNIYTQYPDMISYVDNIDIDILDKMWIK
jgi:hypothetical protein